VAAGKASEMDVTHRSPDNSKQPFSSYLNRSLGGAALCPLKGVEFVVANSGERRREVGNRSARFRAEF